MLVMKSVNVHEAKTHLSRYLKMAQAGERVIICERNVPVAELRPLGGMEQPEVRLGFLEGLANVDDEAFAPLTDEEFEDWIGG